MLNAEAESLMQLIHLLALSATLSMGAQTPDVASQLARQTNPVLLVLAAPEPGQPKPMTSRELLETDGLEEVRIQTVLANPKSPRSHELNRAYRDHLGLPEAHWALVAPGGACAASGAAHLDAAGLKAALEAARILTPIQKLQAFLRRHPDHLEAREKLLARLRGIADQRTRLVLGEAAHRRPPPEARQVPVLRDTLPKPGATLTPEQDLRIWSASYLELGRAYKSGDWMEMNLPPDFLRGMQPAAYPMEAASPLMKGLFRANRNKLLATLREVPEDLNVLNHWMWTSLVLDEPLIPVFESLRPPLNGLRGPAWRGSWPGEPVQRALAAEATAMGDWTRLRRLLIARWADGAEQRKWLRASKVQGSGEADQWQEIGLRALEACLRSGVPEDGAAVLDDALAAKEAAKFLDDAVQLAQRLGHADTAQIWRAWTPRPSLPQVLWGQTTALRSSKTPGRLELVYRLPAPETEAASSFQALTIRLHPEDPQRSDLADAWRHFLGWGPLDLRWAVLDLEGRILRQGFEPMDEKAVGKELEELLPNPSDGYRKSLENARALANDSPWLRLELAMQDQTTFLYTAEQLERMRRYFAERKQPVDPGFEKAMQSRLGPDLLNRMEPILEEGIWKRAGWRVTSLGPGNPGLFNVPGAETAARHWVEALQDALRRKPTRGDFWILWAQWLKLLPDHPIPPFLDQLHLDPLASGADPDPLWGLGAVWPPGAALGAMTDQALASGRWEILEKLLRGLWAEGLRSGEAAGQAIPSGRSNLANRVFRHSGIRLAYAFFQQGRPEEADKVLEAALQAGLGSRQMAATMASNMNFTELAKHWNPPPAQPKDRPQQP